jgi:adenosylcobinamide-phosphate synthase
MEGWAALTLALLVDAAVGDPPRLWRRLPHPVVVIGHAVTGLERLLRRDTASVTQKRLAGVALAGLVVAGAALAGLFLQLALAFPGGWIVEGLLMSTLLAQRSLVQHVLAVAEALAVGLGPARAAVAHLVGRDPESLDAHGVARAALESLAENLSDGVVAPLFWGALLGLPGMLAYKAVNTLDSMVGHRNARYRDLGWAGARLDDVANLVPARLTALVFVAASLACRGRAAAARALRACRRDAGRHRSPNAGWPEAALAGALGLRLAGPRRYAGRLVDDAWMGDGRGEASAADIRAGLRLAWAAWTVAALVTSAPLLALLAGA